MKLYQWSVEDLPQERQSIIDQANAANELLQVITTLLPAARHRILLGQGADAGTIDECKSAMETARLIANKYGAKL